MSFNFTYPQGTDYPLVITVNDENMEPVDLSSSTFEGQAREAYSSGSVLFSFSFTILDQVTDKGKVVAKINNTAITTVLSSNKNAVYDIEMTSMGQKTRILEGKIIITPEVTR